MLVMRPLLAVISGVNAFVMRYGPYTFTSMSRSNSSMLVSATDPSVAMPALLTRP